MPRGSRPSLSLSHVYRLVSFLLGTALIIDYLAQYNGKLGELIAGLILVGILPFDTVLDTIKR